MDWAYKHTKISDWGVGIEKLDVRLFSQADALVDFARTFTGDLGITLRINCAFSESGHSANSQHYLGKAFDGVLMSGGHPLPIAWQLYSALNCQFNGVGVYPEWNSPGLHCDVRDLGRKDTRKVWVQVKGVYYPIGAQELDKLFFIGKDF